MSLSRRFHCTCSSNLALLVVFLRAIASSVSSVLPNSNLMLRTTLEGSTGHRPFGSLEIAGRLARCRVAKRQAMLLLCYVAFCEDLTIFLFFRLVYLFSFFLRKGVLEPPKPPPLATPLLYVFGVSVSLTEFSITVGSITLRFYYN